MYVLEGEAREAPGTKTEGGDPPGLGVRPPPTLPESAPKPLPDAASGLVIPLLPFSDPRNVGKDSVFYSSA